MINHPAIGTMSGKSQAFASLTPGRAVAPVWCAGRRARRGTGALENGDPTNKMGSSINGGIPKCLAYGKYWKINLYKWMISQ